MPTAEENKQGYLPQRSEYGEPFATTATSPEALEVHRQFLLDLAEKRITEDYNASDGKKYRKRLSKLLGIWEKLGYPLCRPKSHQGEISMNVHDFVVALTGGSTEKDYDSARGTLSRIASTSITIDYPSGGHLLTSFIESYKLYNVRFDPKTGDITPGNHSEASISFSRMVTQGFPFRAPDLPGNVIPLFPDASSKKQRT